MMNFRRVPPSEFEGPLPHKYCFHT